MSTDTHMPDPVITAADIFGGDGSSLHFSKRRVLAELLAVAGFSSLTNESPAEDLRDALDRLKAEVVAAKLDVVDRATLLKRIYDELTDKRITHARPLVKMALGDLVPQGKDQAQASTSSIALVDEEPAADPVALDRLLELTAETVTRYVRLSPLQATATALWVGASYAIDALELMPLLLITAPTMRAGKSTLCDTLAAIVPRPLMASNVTGPVLARVIQAYRPTLVLDECDTWLTEDANELRGIINAGHVRAHAHVLRCTPDSLEPQAIACFAARIISGIAKPAATIVDRSIVIELKRKKADEPVERLRRDRIRLELLPLRRGWRRWALESVDAMRDADPALPQGLNDRAADNWRPLLSVAELAGATWTTHAQGAARELSGVGADAGDESSIALQLLADIREIVTRRNHPRWIASADLLADLVGLPDRPWAEWSRGRPLTTVKLAGQLRPFGLRTYKQRVGGDTVNAYDTGPVSEVLDRYFPVKDSEQSEQTNNDGPKSPFLVSEQPHDVPSHELSKQPMFTGSVPMFRGKAADPAGLFPSRDGDDDVERF